MGVRCASLYGQRKGIDLFLKRIQPRLLQAAQWTLVAAFLFFPVVFALGNVVIVLAFVLSLAAGGYRERWQLVRGMPVVWWALGLYAVILAGGLYSPAPLADITLHLSKYAKLLLIPVLLPLLVQDAWRRRCLNAFLAGMGFILVSVYASVFWQLPWSVTQNQGWGGDHTVVGDYITQGVMMTFFATAAVARGRAAVGWQRWAWWVCAALAAVAVTQLSKGRTGYLLLCVAAVIYVFLALQGLRRWVVLCSLAGAMALALLTSQLVHDRIALGLNEAAASDSMETNSIGGRVNFWKHTWQLVQQKPLQGWGTGSYHTVWCQQVTQEGWCGFGGWHPHNQYLFFWMENGVLGLALFLLLVSAPACASARAAGRDRPLLWAFTLIFAVDSLINSPLFSGRESHFFVLLLLWLCAQAHFGGRDAQPAPAALS